MNNARFNDVDMKTRYQNAIELEHGFLTEKIVSNTVLFPNWIADSNCFWYTRNVPSGKEFRIVDAVEKTNTLAFDHIAVANLLASRVDKAVDEKDLPFSVIEINTTDGSVEFSAFEKRWVFKKDGEILNQLPVLPSVSGIVSPDGKKTIYLQEYNLWIEGLEDGEKTLLTTDGERHFAYGVLPERVSLVNGLYGAYQPKLSQGLWSPDSRFFFTLHTDERAVESLPVTRYVPADRSVRPKCVQRKYALPGDEKVSSYSALIIDTNTHEIINIKYPPIVDAVLWAGLVSGNRVWWSKDSDTVFFVDMTRGQKLARVVSASVHTGLSTVLFEEASNTYIDLCLDFESPASLLPLPETNELIWLSERSGWAHIYLYDLNTGSLKNAITRGEWVVREILHFDVARREVLVQISGREASRDPYYRELCSVNVDTGQLSILRSSDHDYIVHKPGTLIPSGMVSLGLATNATSGVSPTGDYLVTTKTRVDAFPVTELVNRQGHIILTVETAEPTGLSSRQWNWPEPVKMLAADNKTDIYGVIYRPSDFSPDRQYPIIDWAHSNPGYALVPKGAFGNDAMGGFAYLSAAALAELGFIVVIIDGRGTCYRSKAFHDESYHNVYESSHLADHVVGIQQLSERYPYMDINRVGIMDCAGSNAPVYGLLAFPEFFKVGAVASLWDYRLIKQGEIYQAANAKGIALGDLASNLQGKLLLIQSMLDNFYHFSACMQLVDALVKENKNIDLVILPNGGHAWDTNHYGLRKIWDYFVEHLLELKPPENFRLSNATEHLIEHVQ